MTCVHLSHDRAACPKDAIYHKQSIPRPLLRPKSASSFPMALTVVWCVCISRLPHVEGVLYFVLIFISVSSKQSTSLFWDTVPTMKAVIFCLPACLAVRHQTA